MNVSARPVAAKIGLFAAAMIWGSTFLLMKETLNSVSTYHLLAIRFSVAAAVLGFLFHAHLRALDRRLFGRGFLLGAFLFAAYALQTEGLKSISPGKSAFLSAVYCIFVPFLGWMFLHRKPTARQLFSGAVCLVGIALISLDSSLEPGKGELLTLSGGLFFSLHIVDLAHIAGKLPMIALTVLQFSASALMAWGVSFLLDEPAAHLTPGISASLLYLCIVGTTTAFLLQNFAQKHISASTASLILGFEAVFGAFFSFLFAHEPLTPRILLGFVLILGAILLAESHQRNKFVSNFSGDDHV